MLMLYVLPANRHTATQDLVQTLEPGLGADTQEVYPLSRRNRAIRGQLSRCGASIWVARTTSNVLRPPHTLFLAAIAKGSAMSVTRTLAVTSLAMTMLSACSPSDSTDASPALVRIANDFNNPEMAFQPPWTICESSFLGVAFGEIDLGQTSAPREVQAGLDYVLMVAAWDDPTCAPQHALPIATKNEEEVVAGQARTIYVNLTSHQGACPPEGVAPIPQAQYDRILQLWPDYGFLPYDQRTDNPQCSGSAETGDAGADAAP